MASEQVAQLSQRGRAMLRVTEYFATSLKVTERGTLLKTSGRTVSYSTSIANMVVS